MEIRVLKYFLMVAREENITHAAELLNITQPTLSRQMIQLEEELGVTLFHRSRHRAGHAAHQPADGAGTCGAVRCADRFDPYHRAAGHDIGNHSSTHPKMTELSRDKMMEEIENCNSLIKNLTGKEVTLFRPPYGDYNNSVVETVNSCGMYCVQWDVDSLDWKDPTAQDMVDRIKSKICPGSIILMHNGATNTPEALPMIIDAVREMGYEFVPISELLLKCDYTTDHKGTMIPAETEEKTESTTAETTKETT